MFGLLFLVVFFPFGVLGLPHPGVPAAGQSIELIRRHPPMRDEMQWAQWANSQRDAVITKYGLQGHKRATGENLVVNEGYDASFFGTLAIGTPSYSYNVILDTGSSDLWVASSSCDSTCSGSGTFDSTKSSTFKSLNRGFNVSYTIGQATGSLVQDVVQMAGFTVSNQQFGSVTSMMPGFFPNPVTGLVGLAWRSLSSSGAMPFWQALASTGSWDSPLMAFHLTRYINGSHVGDLNPGGSLTFGYLNQSLYKGSIDYRNVPTSQPSYWLQEITSLTVQGNSISLPNGSASYAVIDTGTTLVAGPASAIAAIYAQIPGSSPGTGHWKGFYSYPCSHEVNIEISFGGRSWAINPVDFLFQSVGPSSSYCYGAFYSVPTSSNTPQWIIGDTFLKNVYSVFRYDPPSVGFAALSETAVAMNGADATVPTATLGASIASVTATDGASMTTRMPRQAILFVPALLLSIVASLTN